MAELCQSLRLEHRVIECVLNAMATETIRVDNGKPLNSIFVLSVLDFVRKFADGVHHRKEETILFARMEQAGVPRDGGPIGAMLAEHDQLRRTVAAIGSMLDPALRGNVEAMQALVRVIRECVVLWRAHIQREDHVLFPMADQLFTEQCKAEILAAFGEMESRGAAACQRQMAWAESFA